MDIKAAGPGNIIVWNDADAALLEHFPQCIQVPDSKRRMRFLCGLKIALDSHVQLLRSTLKPASASLTQNRRFLNFRHAKNRSVEIASRHFATLRRRDLDVIDGTDQRIHDCQDITLDGVAMAEWIKLS